MSTHKSRYLHAPDNGDDTSPSSSTYMTPQLFVLSGMCPKADDPVTVNQEDREISISVSTASADPIDGYATITFNG